jgi:uncharacterized repeat protein (TIGR02059 family)
VISQIIRYISQKNAPLKNALIIAFLIFSTIASATDYYISSSGNDSNNGLSASTPWKTIAKVNSSFSTLKPGDRILFNRGDTFYGSITVTKSGSVGNPITIGAYGTGANPIITGFTTVNAWTDLGSNIWESTSAVSTLSTCNMVVINGVNTPMGRYPNTGYYTFQSHSGSTSITSNSLSGTPDWTGAEVVVKGYAYVLDRPIITSQSSGTLTFTPATTYEPVNGYGFFIQNDVRTLDKQGDWYYNPSTKKLRVYSTSSPTNVEVASISTLATINSEYITIENITFRGANTYTIYNNTDGVSSNLIIQNCSLLFSGNTLVDLKYIPNFTIENCVLSDANNNGIYIREDCTDAIIRNNAIEDIGLIPGAGQSASGTYTAILQHPNDGILVEYNKLTNLGYNGISFFGNNVLIQYNLINRFGLILDDCGGIYTGGLNLYGKGGGVELTNNKILNNIILNGIGEFSGTPATKSHTSGIYLDYNSNHVEISGNTAANCGNKGVFITSAHDVSMHDNTFYNNDEQLGVQLISTTYLFARNTYTNNIYFSKGTNQSTYHYHITIDGDVGPIPTSDYNYYARPIRENALIAVSIINTTTNLTLAEWQTYSGQDANSHESPIVITDIADIDFYYNETKTNKVITLSLPMIDVKGAKYVNSITLLPFTSVVLMVDPNPAQPVIPVYTGSAIENATPSLLEINYNASLSNIIPASSAFTVLVNSVVRPVNSIAISGTKVLLTLASPVVNGNLVTVAYTMPSTNPLQTTSGGQAVTISAQPVVNNCINVSPTVVITSPINNSSFTALANITVTANALDTDGSISLVEFYNGSVKLGSRSTAPYSFTWNNVPAGTYSLTVIATDNLNAKTISSAISISVINSATTINQSPVVEISNPLKGNKYETNSTITLEAIASDPDGSISKVEFYSGAVKLIELTSAPYTFIWKDVSAGTYSITAVATDNLSATTTSLPIEFSIGTTIKYDANSEIIKLYPNPNDGHFSIGFINPLQNERSEILITDLAGKEVYNGYVSKEETIKQIDLSYIKSGIYILMIIYKEILVTKKFIIN